MHPVKKALREIVDYQRSALNSYKDTNISDEKWRAIFLDRHYCYKECARIVRRAIREMDQISAELAKIQPPPPHFNSTEEAEQFLAEYRKVEG